MTRPEPMPRPTVVVHGGAAATDELIGRAVAACETAAKVGLAAITGGGTAVDAVEVAVRSLEDAPVLNAGTGAALTSLGTIELDASIMDGANLDTGAVACLPPFRNPISIARAVMDSGRHVLYVGEGAAHFAVAAGFEPADPESMITDYARRHLAVGNTVGAVAIDGTGRLAAGTSTGGIPGQDPGRVGDAPVVGAGTYARNGSAACSATGDGEAIVRATLARDVAALIEAGSSPESAAELGMVRLAELGRGTGGLIVIDVEGNVGVAHSTALMSHAVAREGEPVTSGA